MFAENIGTRLLRDVDNTQEMMSMACYIANGKDVRVDFTTFQETGGAITISADEATVELAIKNLQMLLEKARKKVELREDGDHWQEIDKV
ncbi:hypothetical protein D307_gp170 [Bacillus phage Bastille]|uniref:Uncharacterized protein n=2 Tax=Bastillevirus TaxID=1918010 RepID=J9PKI5_9CAUD|nr:hypothetical protein D307_gp170 [Bacillus phage Bastille]YP_009037063.1 hypothetical protein FP74_gp199 [Bacillus phage CAM003]AEQ34294.1 hypothetical protein [Bacillus phage Bastille]AHZ09597.1 hypothetical protein [Bacillus phage CAM003]